MPIPREVEQFAAEAAQFIAWCETPHIGKSPEQFQGEVLGRLAQLYVAGLRLPDVEPPEIPDLPDPTPEQRKKVVENLLALPLQYYWEVFEPCQLDGDREPVCGDLFDDLGDIYVDLFRGARLFEAGHVEAAAFSWRFSFGIHWGRHLVSALHALHCWEPQEEHAS
jgi:hypothetical protein